MQYFTAVNISCPRDWAQMEKDGGKITSVEKTHTGIRFGGIKNKQTKKHPEKQVVGRQVGALFTAQALSEGNMKHKGPATYLEEAAAGVIQGPFL